MNASGIPLAAGIAIQAKTLQLEQATALALVAATAQVQSPVQAAVGDSANFSAEALAALAAATNA